MLNKIKKEKRFALNCVWAHQIPSFVLYIPDKAINEIKRFFASKTNERKSREHFFLA